MTQSIEHFAVRLSRLTRRAIAALLLTGSLISASTWAADPRSDAQWGSGLNIKADRERAGNALDYWIFSDDYCGWASAEPLLSPSLVSPQAGAPTAGTKVLEQRAVSAADLAELAAQEPIDVTRENLGRPISAAASIAVGSSSQHTTVADGYLPYDLSRDDQIALRMYPIAIPQFNYVGGRRSAGLRSSGQGPQDCLGYGVLWTEEVLPAHTVMAAPRLRQDAVRQDRGWEWSAVGQYVAESMYRATQQADDNRRAIALACVEAVQPGSAARHSIDAVGVGLRAGTGLVAAYSLSQDVLNQTARHIASSLPAGRPVRKTEALERTVGEKLLVRAGVELELLDCATAGVAESVADSVCCPVERMELAAQPPRTHNLAVIGVAGATLSGPLEPSAERDPVQRAEAIASACDSAAATLEAWAAAIRQAGDSVVRVARGSGNGGAELR